MPNLAALKVAENWRESEASLHRRSLRGWTLLALGLGFYLVLMLAAHLGLPPKSPALVPLEYIAAHVCLYFPVPLMFAFTDDKRGWRKVLAWLLAVLAPAVLSALGRGNLLRYAGSNHSLGFAVDFLRQVVYPLGLGFWITIFFGKHWQRSCPRGLAELGLVSLGGKRQLIHLGLGLAVAIGLLLHLRLTLLMAGMPQPPPAGPAVLPGLGGFTLAQESLGEELFYRGFFFQYLRRRNWSFWPAALLVACLDAVHFISLPGTLANLTMAVGLVYYVLVYSVINCVLMERTKNLLAPWAANTFFAAGIAVLGQTGVA